MTESWRKNVWALALIVFVAFVGFQFFSPFLPLYVQELGVSDPGKVALWSGLLSAVTPGVSGILSPVFGRLADRFGRKAMLIRSLAGFIVVIAAMGLVSSVQQLLVARLVQGLFAGFTPMVIALASVSAPREKSAMAIGLVQSAQLLSAAIGPAIGGYVASHLGIRYAFFVTSGMCVVALVGLIVLFREAPSAPPGESRRRTPPMPLRRVFRYRHFWVVMVLLVVAQFIDRGLGLLIPLRVAHMPGVTEVAATSGVIISVAAVAATVSANLVARLAVGIPSGRLLVVGLFAGGFFCAAMAFASGSPSLLVLRAFVGLCLGGAITLTYSLGGLIVPAHNRGAAFGWLGLGLQVGTAASPLVTGALASASLAGAFLFAGALAWGGATLLAFGARDLMLRRETLEA